MSSNQLPSKQSRASEFMRNAGTVNDPEHKLWGPARWVVQMIQYLIALIMITVAEGFKSIVSGEGPKKRRQKPRTE
ncbi:hypothetical protein Slin15195_G070590 [Septoria linicola]|uniref:Uncharacterized protein n=1 Tax=Septoria linicola TaxID=215465 RepID=A0A9Q9AWB9_9PEZI|nr:hypothetical protein Slin15195_G070590 [Septoria linicola]